MDGKKEGNIFKVSKATRCKLFSISVAMLMLISVFAAMSRAKNIETNANQNNNLTGNRFFVQPKIQTLGDTLPTAKFKWMAYKLAIFTLVFLDARASTSNDGDRITKYSLKWEESDNFNSVSPFCYHIYRDQGKKMHKVSLFVIDSGSHGSPMTTHLVFAKPTGAHGTFASTYVTQYDNYPLEDLDPATANEQYTEYKTILKGAGWSENFQKTEASATQSVFQNDVPTANFFYHFGHGLYHPWPGDDVTELCLKDWSVGGGLGDVTPSDVKNKWNSNVKWVFLQSCHILEDDTSWPGHGGANYFRDQWAKALNDCHIIMGYASVSYPSTNVLTDFFVQAMGNDLDVVQAYKLATQGAHGSDVKAAVIADTLDQFNGDHLYGHGTVQADEESNDANYYTTQWWC